MSKGTLLPEVNLSAEPEKHSPLVECGFNPDVVAKVSPQHLLHHHECRYDPSCAWCHSVGRRVMTERWNERELTDIAEAKLRTLVKKKNPEACLLWLKRHPMTIWQRLRTLLGV